MAPHTVLVDTRDTKEEAWALLERLRAHLTATRRASQFGLGVHPIKGVWGVYLTRRDGG